MADDLRITPTEPATTEQQGEGATTRCHGYCVEADGSECPGPCPPDGEGEEGPA